MKKVYNIDRNVLVNCPKFMEEMTEVELNSYNMLLVIYKSKPDKRYFDYEETSTTDAMTGKYIISYSPIEKDLQLIKDRMIKEVKEIQEKKLLLTDFKVIRAMRKGISLTAEEQAESDLVYSESSRIENEINALTSIQDIIDFEHEEYQEDVEEIDMETNEPTGETITVTKYKNNTLDW